MFLFVEKEKKVYNLLGHFNIMPQFMKGNSYTCFLVLDNSVTKLGITPRKSETDDEYKVRVDDAKDIIKHYIKKEMIYGKKIE